MEPPLSIQLTGMTISPPHHPFRMLFAAHAPFVARCARTYGVRDDDVPDVVQQVFVALHQAIARGLDLSRPLRPWLCAVTYRTARDHRRRAMNQREVLSVTGCIEAADAAPDPEETVQAIDVHRMTNRVLDELPPELRIVLAMSDIDELPVSAIAAALEIPLGTAYTRLRAARRAFEEAWNRQRATSDAMVQPFALWDAGALLHAARATPNLAPEIMDTIWRGLVDSIGPSIAGAAAGGAAAAASSNGATALAAKKITSLVVAMLAGAGVYAALHEEPDRSIERKPVVLANHEGAPATSDTGTAAAPPAIVVHDSVPVSTAIAKGARKAPPQPSATARAVAATSTSERTWLEAARDALDRGDVAAARAALAHVEGSRFASERDALWRLVLAQQDGGP